MDNIIGKKAVLTSGGWKGFCGIITKYNNKNNKVTIKADEDEATVLFNMIKIVE